MSQPQYAVEYLGAEVINKGETYSSTTIKTKYPTATMMKMKTEGVEVSINGTTMFPTTYDGENYIPTVATSFLFSKNCIIAIGRYVAVST